MLPAWAPCPLITGDQGAGAECAQFALPLSSSDLSGQTISIFVKRVRATQASRGQLWLLAGGPGESGARFDARLARYAALNPTLDVYVPDHRGTGRSSRLACPGSPDDEVAPDAWPACTAALEAAWGPRLGAFTVTAAARDLGALVERTRAPGQEVHVLAQSYGTVLAQRYLQLFPDQPTSVTLDSVCQPGACSPFTAGDALEEAGRRFLGACGADALCSRKLGADPVEYVRRFLDGLDAGACPPLAAMGLDGAATRHLFGALVGSFDRRVLVPAIAYRGTRCAPGDLAAIEHLAATFASAAPSPAKRLDSEPLFFHIALSELASPDPPSLASLQAAERTATFATGLGTLARSLYDAWPRYPRDPFVGGWPRTRAPMLLLDGTLDAVIPLEIAAGIAAHYRAPHQTFVPIERAPHGAIERSPTRDPPHTPCGLSLWIHFLQDPTAPVDASCAADVEPLDFAGTPGLAAASFGAADLWENASTH